MDAKAKLVGKLTAKKRNSLKTSTFGLPGKRAYPMPDKAHAIAAKARAEEEVKKHHLSKSEQGRIDAMANRIIKRGK